MLRLKGSSLPRSPSSSRYEEKQEVAASFTRFWWLFYVRTEAILFSEWLFLVERSRFFKSRPVSPPFCICEPLSSPLSSMKEEGSLCHEAPDNSSRAPYLGYSRALPLPPLSLRRPIWFSIGALQGASSCRGSSLQHTPALADALSFFSICSRFFSLRQGFFSSP